MIVIVIYSCVNMFKITVVDLRCYLVLLAALLRKFTLVWPCRKWLLALLKDNHINEN